MKWADATKALLGLAEGDTALIAALKGPKIYRRREYRKGSAPSVEYTIITTTLDESMEPVLTQWDIFATSLGQLTTIEARLRRIFHWVGWKMVGGVMMNSVYVDSRDHPPPEPGVWHRSIDFRHQPVRTRGGW